MFLSDSMSQTVITSKNLLIRMELKKIPYQQMIRVLELVFSETSSVTSARTPWKNNPNPKKRKIWTHFEQNTISLNANADDVRICH